MGTDSLCYIMDYSGHYYRTNQADQLVAAAGEQEATVFTFAQANRHIGVGRKHPFIVSFRWKNRQKVLPMKLFHQ